MTGRAPENRRRDGEIYISVDVETDGPIPGDCNMVSIGASVCGKTMSGSGWHRIDSGKTFYRELTTEFPGSPDTRRWLAGQGFEVNGPNAVHPATAMRHFKEWVDRIADAFEARPVFVAYPLGFDWSFTHWYFEHYLGPKSDPFGFSNALDIKTFFSAKSGRALLGSLKRNLPAAVRKVNTPHTHNAKDDAVGQGELFANLMEWKPGGRKLEDMLYILDRRIAKGVIDDPELEDARDALDIPDQYREVQK